jgi:20S proteasome alpha/beta subunit
MKTFSILLLLLLAFPVYAQRQYDASGAYTGSIKQEGSRLVERDASGGIVGYWITAGGTTSHYDRGGSLLGRSRP